MADVKIDDLMAMYEAEIGRLSGEIIRLRAAFAAQLAELTSLATTSADVDAQNAP